jgi:hypothetical protein
LRWLDLMPLNLFVWRHQKGLVYRDWPSDMEDLAAESHAAVGTTVADILWQVEASIPRCVVTCWWMFGGHFEHLKL